MSPFLSFERGQKVAYEVPVSVHPTITPNCPSLTFLDQAIPVFSSWKQVRHRMFPNCVAILEQETSNLLSGPIRYNLHMMQRPPTAIQAHISHRSPKSKRRGDKGASTELLRRSPRTLPPYLWRSIGRVRQVQSCIQPTSNLKPPTVVLWSPELGKSRSKAPPVR